ncbi:MAG TPA: substrate-binding domain-containing protein [Clostridiaceae bacterium]|nr:substrate-binding domain-containing protein [Clostridiaceae bacterium]
MKKRILAALLAGAMVFGLAACGGGDKETEETTAAETTTEEATDAESETEKETTTEADAADDASSAGSYVKDDLGEVVPNEPYKLGLTIGWRDQFLSQLESAVIENAKLMGCEITSVDANNNANDQLGHIQNFVGQGVDAIICVLAKTENAQQVIDAAGDTPVVFVNIVPEMDLTGMNATKVGSDELQAGQFQGEFLTEYFKEKGQDDVKYVLLQGTLGLNHTTARTNAAHDTLAASGLNVECVYEDTAEYDRAKAQNKMQTYLGTNPEFDCVIANNDEMALGAIEAMKSVGVDPAEIPVVGIDATPSALQAMEAGELAMTVFQDAKGQGAGGIRAAVLMANGEDVPPQIYIPFIPVTPDNMAEFVE